MAGSAKRLTLSGAKVASNPYNGDLDKPKGRARCPRKLTLTVFGVPFFILKNKINKILNKITLKIWNK